MKNNLRLYILLIIMFILLIICGVVFYVKRSNIEEEPIKTKERSDEEILSFGESYLSKLIDLEDTMQSDLVGFCYLKLSETIKTNGQEYALSRKFESIDEVKERVLDIVSEKYAEENIFNVLFSKDKPLIIEKNKSLYCVNGELNNLVNYHNLEYSLELINKTEDKYEYKLTYKYYLNEKIPLFYFLNKSDEKTTSFILSKSNRRWVIDTYTSYSNINVKDK